LDEKRAQAVAERWSGTSGLVPRGPKMLMAVVPATPSDVERHTGARPDLASGLWRLEIGGRFLRSGGLVYPGGVPYPEELHSQTAVISNEVWLYTDDGGHVLGSYWWPDAVRRPIASMPRAQFSSDDVVEPSELAVALDLPLRLPKAKPWSAATAVRSGPKNGVVFYVKDALPDPLHEMLLFEAGGLALFVRGADGPLDVAHFLLSNQPPYRRVSAGGAVGLGRDPGRALGPQTWPWPGELRWRDNGVEYELKGFLPLTKLQAVASS
jgi:hypothetical protein